MSPFSSCASRNLGTVSEVLGFCPSLVINGGTRIITMDFIYVCVCLSLCLRCWPCLFPGDSVFFFLCFLALCFQTSAGRPALAAGINAKSEAPSLVDVDGW